MSQVKATTIGVVGGVGPFAGLDLVKKIFEQTAVAKDQEHLPVVLVSLPHLITDRTAFLAGKEETNPGQAIADIVLMMEDMNVDVAGIPCNTAHAPKIYDMILEALAKRNSRIQLLHMIDEVAVFLRENFPELKRVGVLGTEGSFKAKIYEDNLGSKGYEVLIPDAKTKREVHEAIYDPEYGVKAQGNRFASKVREVIIRAIEEMRARRAEGVVLGCTELPLAVPELSLRETVLIDPNTILARALVKRCDSAKLRPYIPRGQSLQVRLRNGWR